MTRIFPYYVYFPQINFILQNKTLMMLFNEKSVYLFVIDVTQVRATELHL